MQTVADILTYAEERSPRQTALTANGQKISYQALLSQAKAVGSSLLAKGLRPGDCIMTLLQNHQGAAVLHWAAQLYGLAICPLNWRTTASELDYFASDCRARAIFYDHSSKAAVKAYAPTSDVFVAEFSADTWATAPWLCHGTPAPMPTISDSDISVVLYTSGTTGTGKGVPRTHGAERAAALAHVAQNALLSGDVSLGVMPLYHTMGVRILLSTALLSGCFVCQPKFDAAHTLGLIEAHAISSLYLVPTLYHDLVNELAKSPRRFSSITRLGVAGASMSDGLLRSVAAAFPGVNLVNHYGSSEIYTYSVTQNAARKPGSAGRAGLNSKIAIIPLGTSDVTRRARPGEEGQVIALANSAEAFAGYLNRPDADAKALKQGWYLTGDVGYFDEDGDLFLTGRVDDMIITGGENVMPIEIESVLSLHPDVSEAIVVGKPDDRLGEKITAFIVPRQPVCRKELDSYCRKSGLPGYRCPKDYQFVEAIPRSPVGKILRRLL